MAKDMTEGYIGIGKQAAKGTSVVPAFMVKYTSVKFSHGIGSKEIDDEGGGTTVPAEVEQTIKTEHKPDVEVGYRAKVATMGKVLAYLLGRDTKTGDGTTTPHTHTLSVQRPLPWLSLERRIGGQTTHDIIERFYDCIADNVKIEFPAGEAIKATSKFMGINTSWITSPTTESYETGDRFVFSEGTGTLDNLLLDGVAAGRMREGSVEISNTVKGDDIEGTTPKRLDVFPSLFKMKLSLTVASELDDTDAFYRKINYGSATGTGVANTLYKSSTNAFKIKWLLTGTSGVNEKSIEIIIPIVEFIAAPIELSGGGGLVTMAIEGNAVKPATNLSIVVKTGTTEATAWV